MVSTHGLVWPKLIQTWMDDLNQDLNWNSKSFLLSLITTRGWELLHFQNKSILRIKDVRTRVNKAPEVIMLHIGCPRVPALHFQRVVGGYWCTLTEKLDVSLKDTMNTEQTIKPKGTRTVLSKKVIEVIKTTEISLIL